MIAVNNTDLVFNGAFKGMESRFDTYDYTFVVAKGEHNEPVIAIHTKSMASIMPMVIVNSIVEKDANGMWWRLDVKIRFPEILQLHDFGVTPQDVVYLMTDWIEIAKITTNLANIKIPYVA